MKPFLRSIITVLVLSFAQSEGFSQCSSVPPINFNNPSFEGTPQSHVVPSPWVACQGGQTPDTQPGSWGITLPATNGNTYVGFVHQPSSGWQEGASQQLPTPMVTGVNYSFTLDVANANQSSVGVGIIPGCAELRIYGGFSACDYNTLLWSSGNITPYDTWQNHTVSFTASLNFTWILIRIHSLGCTDGAYILVDNISPITVQSQPILLTPTILQPTCSGASTGSAYMSYSGGLRPFTFQWSNGVTTQANGNLFAGTYGITATDAIGCTATASITISQANAVALTATATNATCGNNNGTVSTTVTGGSGQLSYLWSNSATSSSISNLSPGAYSVTVNDVSGCSATANATVGATAQLVLASSGIDAVCGASNGSAGVNVTNGSGPFSYSWSNGANTPAISGLSPGTYTVTVTGADGCSASSNVLVNTSLQLGITTTATDAACGSNNGTAIATVTAGSGPFTYWWSNSSSAAAITNLSEGTYTVTVTGAGGCSATSSVTVNAASGLGLTSNTIDATCGESNGSATVAVTSGNGPYTYSWSNASTAPIITNIAAGTYSVTVTGANNCSATSSITVNGAPAVAFSLTHTDALCSVNNGSATATVNSGTLPFTYLWSNNATTASITNLAPGSYSITVTGAGGCTATSSVTISLSNEVTLFATATNATCAANNGNASVTALSGTAPFTYLWSTGETTPIISNVAVGTYSVTVTSQDGCTATASPTVSSSTPVVISTAVINTSCGSNNGSVTVTATAGTAPYTYTWNNGGTTAALTNLAPGTYSVTVNDAGGCSATAVAEVEVSSSTPAVITTNKTSMCSGDSAQVCVQGTYASYQWNTGQTTQCIYAKFAGNYYATATDANGCTIASNRIAISVLPLPPVSISVNGDTLTGYNAVTYQWYYNGTAIPGATSQTFIAPQAGDYTLAVTDSNGCRAVSSKVSIVVLGIDEVIGEAHVEVYPNPVQSENWNIEVSEDLLNSRVEIFNAEGRLVYRSKINNVKSKIDLDVARGVYMMRVYSAAKTFSFKLIKL